MDAPDADSGELVRSLGFLRVLNRMLGYTRATIRHLERFSRRWAPGQTVRILDLGTGSADIPRAILRWADGRGFDIQIVGVDLHPVTALAAASPRDQRLQIVQADVADLPFGPGTFDYCLTSMFLHHLGDEQVIDVMKTMNRLSRRGVLIADLLRDPLAYRWIQLFSAFSTPMVRHDGPASIAQAFTKAEILHLRDRGGLMFARYHHHAGYRFILAGEKR